MALAAAGFNFNGFIEVNDLISHRIMIAYGNIGEAEPCEFLQEMDRREYQILQAEDLELKNIIEKAKTAWGPFAVSFGGLALASFSFVSVSSSDSHNDSKTFIIMLAGLSLFGIGTTWGLVKIADSVKVRVADIGEIYDKRILRLQSKVRALEGRINDINLDVSEKEQMSKARDFFGLKQQVYIAEKINTVKVKRVF